MPGMGRSRGVTRTDGAKGARAGRTTYHHGDLPRAMVRQAVRTIQRQGLHALTLRGVGEQLGVSRTALYRHFTDKNDLLKAVAAEGFRLLQAELREAWTSGGEGQQAFDAMGRAYIQFAVRHQSHYRVMFGGALRGSDMPTPDRDGTGDAFATLVHALESLQHAGVVRADHPQQLALYVWAVVHGVAMLAIDGVLRSPDALDGLTRLAIERLRTGIASTHAP